MPNRYYLGSVLNHGSEGVVYLGKWSGMTAAIKVLSNNYARRAENEAKLVMSCNHINIIKYFDSQYENGKAYLAMEYINGGNLYEFIGKMFGSDSYWIHMTQILQDIAHGMSYLHDHRIVQADLKSHNILLRDSTFQAVICDFGISRLLDGDNPSSKRSQTAKGTIRWMAPEICTPPPELPFYESDVWSYGCIILEIVSSREPWTAQYNDDSQLFRALQRQENAPIFARICANQPGPASICELLKKCCSWSKGDRPKFKEILKCLDTDDTFLLRTHSSAIENDCDEFSFDYSKHAEASVNQSYEIEANRDNTRNGVQVSFKTHDRLTGEVYTSKGSASGRVIYEGIRGGRYYLSATGSKVYLHK